MNFGWLKNNVDSLIAAFVGFIIIMLFTRHGGIGISPDSIAYTAAARSFATGHGFNEFTGGPLVSFPLFYPFFIGVLIFITRTDIIVLAPVLNALMYAGVIYLSGFLMEKFKYKTNWYKGVMLAILTISPSLIEIYTMLWSETLFILLSLFFILYFRRYFKTHKIAALVRLAVITAIAFDTRFAGVALVGTGCVLIIFDKNLKWKTKAIHGLIFIGISFSLVTLNLIRNTALKGLATGMRQKGITPLGRNIGYSGNVMSDWFSIHSQAQLFFILVATAVMILFIVFFIRNIRHWKAFYTYENISVALFIVYVSFIVVSSTISRYETINNRLLAPAFLPFLWISTCQLPKWRKYMPHKRLKEIFWIFSVGIALLLIGSYVAINRDNLSYMRETGIPGYSEDTWTQSKIVNYLQQHKELFDTDTEIYSNHSQAVYFLTGNSVEAIPERVYKQDVAYFKESDPCYLIWFNLDPNSDLLSLREIHRMKKMKLVHSFNDGAIFLLNN